MNIRFDEKQNMEMVTLFPGEYHATKENRIITTVLGSCIAVALYDPLQKIGGMNHFMLPESLSNGQFYLSKSGKYGMYAMELLINDLLKLGVRKTSLQAKVFGGGHVLDQVPNMSARVPDSNIRFAFDFLKAEKIPVSAQDVGGTSARKILFFTHTARIKLKRITKNAVRPLETRESEYLKKIRLTRPAGDVTLF